jgi:hypothetical protein
MSDMNSGFTYFQDLNLTLAESIHLHFKPTTNTNASLLALLFVYDFIMGLAFQIGHIYFFMMLEFENENNHMLHVLIGAGFTGIIGFYSFTDGVRFLRSNIDKFLYLLCCLLQKPILLPVLLPSRFRSRISEKHLQTHTVKLTRKNMVDGKEIVCELVLQPTNFLLAVQETNFLYSFTLSGFVAMSTSFTLLENMNFSGEQGYLNAWMLIISLLYAISGLCISIYLYGRKTEHLEEYWKVREEGGSIAEAEK